MKVLITAANSDISIGIARILKASFADIFLIGVAPDGQWPGAHFFDIIHEIARVEDFQRYTLVLETLIAKYSVDILCPIAEKEMAAFIDQQYCPLKNILINPAQVIGTCLDKYQTASWLGSIGVPVPETFLFHDENAKLLKKSIIKPRSSAGSKNTYYVDNNLLFDAIQYTYRNSLNDFVVQRAVGSKEDEYTCALWRFGGEFRYIILKRKLQGGLTGEAEVLDNEMIANSLKKIAINIDGDFFINVQLRLEDGVPYVFEINPRFSSTIVMRHKIGFQDVFWTFLSVMKESLPTYVEPISGTKLFRLSEELIVTKGEKL